MARCRGDLCHNLPQRPSRILFGVVLTTVFFMVEYSGMTGVTQKATLSEVRSHVERDDEQNQIIDTYGRQVAVFWCAGYIFFGTAQDIVEELQASLDASPSTHILILDFEQVPAVDASGVQALVSFAGERPKATTGCHPCDQRCRAPPAAVLGQMYARLSGGDEDQLTPSREDAGVG